MVQRLSMELTLSRSFLPPHPRIVPSPIRFGFHFLRWATWGFSCEPCLRDVHKLKLFNGSKERMSPFPFSDT